MKISTSLLLCLISASVLAQIPTPTPWANQWKSDFSENLKEIISGSTTGTIYYDWTNKLFRIDRANGQLDRYCGIPKYIFSKTPCHQYVVSGWRYLHFPEKKYCCKCCSAEHGCGMVFPTWAKDGKYQGQKTYKDGSVVNEWDVKGLQSNTYAEILTSHVPKRVFQDPLSDMTFDQSTYSTRVDPAVFKLPTDQGCELSCPSATVCSIVGRTATN